MSQSLTSLPSISQPFLIYTMRSNLVYPQLQLTITICCRYFTIYTFPSLLYWKGCSLFILNLHTTSSLLCSCPFSLSGPHISSNPFCLAPSFFLLNILDYICSIIHRYIPVSERFLFLHFLFSSVLNIVSFMLFLSSLHPFLSLLKLLPFLPFPPSHIFPTLSPTPATICAAPSLFLVSPFCSPFFIPSFLTFMLYLKGR